MDLHQRIRFCRRNIFSPSPNRTTPSLTHLLFISFIPPPLHLPHHHHSLSSSRAGRPPGGLRPLSAGSVNADAFVWESSTHYETPNMLSSFISSCFHVHYFPISGSCCSLMVCLLSHNFSTHSCGILHLTLLIYAETLIFFGAFFNFEENEGWAVNWLVEGYFQLIMISVFWVSFKPGTMTLITMLIVEFWEHGGITKKKSDGLRHRSTQIIRLFFK